jgi:hypothetical protein
VVCADVFISVHEFEGHVPGRADVSWDEVVIGGAYEPEIGEFGLEVLFREEDVLQFDIAMSEVSAMQIIDTR